jgi:predicted permease
MTILDEVRQDVRYALRALAAAPGFTAAALLTLALGIGATTAIFSIVRGVLLEPLPFADPERLVRIWHANPAQGIEKSGVSEPDFLDWREQSQHAESMAGFWFQDQLSGLDLTGSGDPERMSAALVTDGFFETLGTPPLLGRWIVPDEHVDGRNRVAVLSHGLWTRRYGADPAILGRTLTLNDEPFQIAGIMPPGFTYPAERTLDLWIPLSFFGPDDIGRARNAQFMGVIARVRQGASEPQLRTELSGIAARLSREHPENPAWDRVTTAGIRESLVGDVRTPLLVLMAAVAMLLVVACVNIAGLLLARAAGRQQELAVRAALGAGRGRIARQLVTESLTLAAIGGLLGIALAVLALRAFAAAGATELPRVTDVGLDGTVLAFTVAVSLLSGLLFGVVPALRAASNLEATLRAGGRAVAGRGHRLRAALVVAEVALSLVLLVGAGLAVKSFARLTTVDPGFDPSNALVVGLSIPERYDSPDAARSYYYRLLEAVRGVPGVEAAGAIRDLPLLGNGELTRPGVSGRALAPGEEPAVQRHHVSTDFFTAMRIPVIAGRAFDMTDRAGAPPVIVINEELARRVWPGEDPVGKALRFGQTDVRVIGVVGNVRQRSLAEPADPALYMHVLQQQRSRMSMVIRAAGRPEQYANAVRQAIWAQDPDQTITTVTTLEAVLGTAVSRPRVLAWLLAAFGAIGVTLGALGIFALLAYAVSERQQEIGVRVALGAPPRAVLASVLAEGMALAALGIAGGTAAALLLTRSMQGVLFDVRPTDPATFAQVAAVMLIAALLASWLPARRALAVDPVTALRNG